MYEMQGPGPVFGRWPAGCPAGFWLIDRLLVPGTRVKFRFPGSSCVPGLPPAWFPSPAVTYFYCPEPRWHKGFRALISRLFRCPQGIHSGGGVVPRNRHVSTSPSTTSSTGGWRKRRCTGANVIAQSLAARLVDEIRIHLSPLVLGDGTRLFDLAGPTRLVQREVIKSPRATHLTYEVVRD
jgi:RibD C-terminal domain